MAMNWCAWGVSSECLSSRLVYGICFSGGHCSLTSQKTVCINVFWKPLMGSFRENKIQMFGYLLTGRRMNEASESIKLHTSRCQSVNDAIKRHWDANSALNGPWSKTVMWNGCRVLNVSGLLIAAVFYDKKKLIYSPVIAVNGTVELSLLHFCSSQENSPIPCANVTVAGRCKLASNSSK